MTTAHLTEIKLYGFLGKKYGKRFFMAVNSPAEAVRALASQFKTFRRDLANYKPGYGVFVNGRDIGPDQLTIQNQPKEIRFVPVVSGSKGGVFQIILGVILVVVGVLTYAYGGGVLIGPGLAMIAGGVIQLLSSPPKTGSNKGDGALTSYAFSGPVNTTAQGHAVPLLYGLLEVGSAVISAGIYITQNSSGSAVGTVPINSGDGTGTGIIGSGDSFDATQGGASPIPVFGNEGGG